MGYVHREDNNSSIFLNLDLLEVFGEKRKCIKNTKNIFEVEHVEKGNCYHHFYFCI
jgi:hypothetical protein